MENPLGDEEVFSVRSRAFLAAGLFVLAAVSTPALAQEKPQDEMDWGMGDDSDDSDAMDWGMEGSSDDMDWGQDPAMGGEEAEIDYFGNAGRLAIGQLRHIELPDIWPPGREVPNSKNNCLRCHLLVGGSYTYSAIDFAGSRHDEESLSCDMCHGGDTTDDEYSHARSGYIGTHPGFNRERCVDCHFVSAKIFESSIHHKEEYDWQFPRCYECHGEHAVGKGEILMADACTSCHGAKATKTSGEGESAIIWKSPLNGSLGNAISITMLAGEANQELSIEADVRDDGTDLVVYLETDSDGNPISLAEEVMYEISMDPEFLHVIYCEEGDGYLGEDVAQPEAKFFLEGGEDYGVKYPNYVELINADDIFWESLRRLREHKGEVPSRLNGHVTVLKKRFMELIHGSPKEPDPNEIAALINATQRLKEEVDTFLKG